MTDETEAQRIVVIDGDEAADGVTEAILRRTASGDWEISRDGGSTWESLGGGGSGSLWRPLMAQDPADDHWYVVVDGDGTAVMVED